MSSKLPLTLCFAVLIWLSPGCAQRDRHATGDRLEAGAPANVEVVEEFWPSGRLRLRRHVIRQPDGTLVDDGGYTRWYDNGRKEYEATYVQGKLDGVEIRWHRNGRKATEQYYANGLRNGPRYDWDEEGNLRREERYYEDKPDGTWTVWNKDGTVKWQATFNKGVPQA